MSHTTCLIHNNRECVDAVIQFDCDLQDPPKLLPQFLEQWELGNKIVYGLRMKRKESVLMQIARKSFYRLANFLSEEELEVILPKIHSLQKRIYRFKNSLN